MRLSSKIAKFIFLILFSLILVACGGEKTEAKMERFEGEKVLFNTYIKIIIYDTDSKNANKKMEAAFNEIERVDRKFNSKDTTSVISKLNANPTTPIKFDDEGLMLLKRASETYDLSNGKFDITIYPLLETWGFTSDIDRKTLPSATEIKNAQGKIDFKKVKINGSMVSLEAPVKEIDTGAYLKGYAVERGKQKLIEMGVKSGFISSTSSIVTIGTKPGNIPWKVGVQNPENPSEIYGVVDLNGESMGVSGDYQTFVEIGGKKYHHIIDKTTGYPVSDKKMVVVIGKSGFDTDLYSTAFFLMDNKKILDYAKTKDGMKVFILDNKMNEIKSDNFILQKQK